MKYKVTFQSICVFDFSEMFPSDALVLYEHQYSDEKTNLVLKFPLNVRSVHR